MSCALLSPLVAQVSRVPLGGGVGAVSGFRSSSGQSAVRESVLNRWSCMVVQESPQIVLSIA